MRSTKYSVNKEIWTSLNIIMSIICTLFVVVLCMGAGDYIGYKYRCKFVEHTFVDYELIDEDENEYPEWIDCEDESDNLYI